ncbi:hypothetical protein KC347_g98 [Hortaea werneckii]|nr:hypothetical protein KC347_g98 [Hortaea werneckii]
MTQPPSILLQYRRGGHAPEVILRYTIIIITGGGKLDLAGRARIYAASPPPCNALSTSSLGVSSLKKWKTSCFPLNLLHTSLHEERILPWTSTTTFILGGHSTCYQSGTARYMLKRWSLTCRMPPAGLL